MLLKANVSVVARERCTEEYSAWRKLPQGVTTQQLCAGDPEGLHDTCQVSYLHFDFAPSAPAFLTLLFPSFRSYHSSPPRLSHPSCAPFPPSCAAFPLCFGFPCFHLVHFPLISNILVRITVHSILSVASALN